MKSHGAAHSEPGCAMGLVDCTKKSCKPAEVCKLGDTVYRGWTDGGHHHTRKEEKDATRTV